MLFHAQKGTLSRFRPLSRKRLIHRIIYTNKNHNIMIKKLLYTAPESELLFVKFEENIMSNTGESFTPVNMNGGFDEDEDDE
jgi:hypothetical protein